MQHHQADGGGPGEGEGIVHARLARQFAGDPGGRQEARQVAEARIQQVADASPLMEDRQLEQADAEIGHRRQGGAAGTADQGTQQQGRHLQGDAEGPHTPATGLMDRKGGRHQAADKDQEEAGDRSAPGGKGPQ